MNRDERSPFDSAFMEKLERLSLFLRRHPHSITAGRRTGSRAGVGVEFYDKRTYVPGDDPRYVDWNVYARMEELTVKMFHEEGDIGVYLLLDTSRSMQFGEPTKGDFAKRVAAALGYIALCESATVTLLYPGTKKARGASVRGKRQIFRLMETLKKASPADCSDWYGAIARLFPLMRRKGVVIILSDLMVEPEQLQRSLALLRYQGMETRIVHVLSPQDVSPPHAAEFTAVDSETLQEVEIMDAGGYEDLVEEYFKTIDRMAAQLGIPLCRTMCDADLESFVLEELKRKGFYERVA